MKHKIFIIVLLLFAMPSASQIKVETFKVKTYNPSNITEDSHGNIWFHPLVLLGGNLTKYDGEKFESFTKDKKKNIIYNFQSVIEEDNEGNVWFGGVGLTKYDGENWTNWKDKKNFGALVLSMQFDEKDNMDVFCSKMFYGGINGRIKNGTYESVSSFPMEGAVSTIFEDSKGNCWYGAWRDGVYMKTGDNWTDYSKDLKLKWLTNIIEDNEGNIWAFAYEGRHAVYRDGKWEEYKYGSGFFTMQAGTAFILGILPGIIAGYVIEDKATLPEVIVNDDEILILVRKKGIISYKGEEMTEFQKVYKKDLKSPKKIRDMIKDNEGNIWIVNTSGYVAKFDGVSWEVFDEDIPKGMRAMLQDSNGNFWLAGHKQIAKFTYK